MKTNQGAPGFGPIFPEDFVANAGSNKKTSPNIVDIQY
jgi:hypothetical protein